MTVAPLRVVVFSALMTGYRLVEEWAARHGHEVVLVVTPPVGAGRRYDVRAQPLVLDLPKESHVLVTGALAGVAAPVIAALTPDLVISAAFPRRIPPEALVLPRYGALNLHPSALPAGRGPNPFRLVYEGASTIGATLHRTAEDFDTGPVLSRREAPLPPDLSASTLLSASVALMAQVLEEGAARAVAGEPGYAQDGEQASHTPPFTETEQLLDFTDPAPTLRRKVAALNVLGPRPIAVLDGVPTRVGHLYEAEPGRHAAPGAVLARHGDGWTVQAEDQAVRILTM
ncbi:formyltransferase family protein [Streptomyces sp. NBC_00555]|uniref:methionyl-tRNA formyltransferase n=1 Tax=Streptomyces sp. NBC_00555 TaxID=2903662 RepID=UPI002253B249|nr:formyltransferase family protein [Streptomyces sp. NBC_00555]MCX5010383.1 formyltransferase family protein [Streptomyces sp. NBC_00555]